MTRPSGAESMSDAAERSIAGLALADEVAFHVLEAAEDSFDVSLHYVVGSIKCSVNPDAVSLYLSSKHAAVFFMVDGRGDVWLIDSPLGSLPAPARRISAADDPHQVSMYCLKLLSGADRGLRQMAAVN